MDESWKNSPTMQKFLETSIVRSLKEHGVLSGSPLEADVRTRAHLVWGYREAGVSATDDRNRTLTLDVYIKEQKENPAFATSLVPERPKERVGISDQQQLLSLDIRKILNGQAEVFDDRERQPR
jgi:hypothetical protein